MAFMSKRQYVEIATALKAGRANVLDEAQAVFEDNDLHELGADPRYWAKFGFMTAVKYIADVMERDNRAFNREHFLEVVRGNRKVDSSPTRPHTWGEPTKEYKDV